MMISYMDYTAPSTEFTYDVSNNTLFKKDDQNYINLLSIKQLNTLGNSSLLDIYLSTANVVEPHYHQNATELVYCISGAAVVSLINPFTNKLHHFPILPGQVANVPQGWWHYEVATVDNTHLLAIFDAPTPEVILGSDILRLTPTDILSHTYCLDEAKVKDTLAPITKSVFIGPPSDCVSGQVQGSMTNMAQPNQAYQNQVSNYQTGYNQPSINQIGYNQTYGQYSRQQVYPPQVPTNSYYGWY